MISFYRSENTLHVEQNLRDKVVKILLLKPLSGYVSSACLCVSSACLCADNDCFVTCEISCYHLVNKNVADRACDSTFSGCIIKILYPEPTKALSVVAESKPRTLEPAIALSVVAQLKSCNLSLR